VKLIVDCPVLGPAFIFSFGHTFHPDSCLMAILSNAHPFFSVLIHTLLVFVGGFVQICGLV